jgi:hypothetical protein
MIRTNHRPIPDLGWGSSALFVRTNAFDVTGRSGAGRDANATAQTDGPQRVSNLNRTLNRLCNPLNFNGRTSVPAWDTQT